MAAPPAEGTSARAPPIALLTVRALMAKTPMESSIEAGVWAPGEPVVGMPTGKGSADGASVAGATAVTTLAPKSPPNSAAAVRASKSCNRGALGGLGGASAGDWELVV